MRVSLKCIANSNIVEKNRKKRERQIKVDWNDLKKESGVKRFFS